MKRSQVEQLVSRWLSEALDESEDARAIGKPLTDDQVEDERLGLSLAFDNAYEGLRGNDYRSIEGEAESLLVGAGRLSGDDYKRFCRRLLHAKIEYLRIEYDRLGGEYGTGPAQAGIPSPDDDRPRVMFSEALSKYMAQSARPPRTAKPLLREFERFMACIGGDRSIGDIRKADIVAYKDRLQGERGCHPTTVMKHLTSLDALFKWAEVHGLCGASPVKGLTPSKRQTKKAALRRVPYTDAELVKIFGSDDFQSQRLKRPERFWIPLILLYQACRREEAGQLYRDDLLTVDGIPCLRITDERPDQTLKNDGSRRTIPLHPRLIELGILDYAGAVRGRRLFPGLKHKSTNGYSNPIGTWWGRLTGSLGIDDPRKVIHSLRHGGITRLHAAGVPTSHVEVLVGHSAGGVHDGYVHRDQIPMTTLRDALSKLEYTGLNIGHQRDQ